MVRVTAARSGTFTRLERGQERRQAAGLAQHLSARGGVTVLELLVTMTVIGVLVALLLPAVGSARAAARRLQCQQNLRQLALALHQYHNTCRSFPYGVNGGWGQSWSTHVLPFIQQAPLAARVPWSDRGWWRGTDQNSRALQQLAQTHLPLFRCPADPAPVTCTLNQLAERYVTSYLACAGGDARHDNHGPGGMSQSNGIILAADFLDADRGPARPHALRDIRDGTSNTLLISEAVFLVNEQAGCGTCDRFYLYHPNADTRSGSDFSEALGSTYYPINSLSHREQERECSYSSCHVQGVQAAMADGSTRFCAQSIDLKFWRRCGSLAE